MRLNPLTWCTSAVREAIQGGGLGGDAVAAAAFAVVMIAAAVGVVARRSHSGS
jgi:hypothetical protein